MSTCLTASPLPVFQLPGGYIDESGRIHDEAQLAPLTGWDEYALGSLEPGTNAAIVITSLLVRCVRRIGSLDQVDTSLVRELLVADRDYLIIKLRSLTFGSRVDCVMHCPDPECSKLMDLTFNLDELEFERKPVKQRYFKLAGGEDGQAELELDKFAEAVEFRFPTGADQEACAPIFTIDKEAAIAELLSRCMRPLDNCAGVNQARVSSLDAPTQLEIEARLGQMAPHVEIELEAACPECEKPLDADFDALSFFLEELKGNLRRLERDVHFLAWHYHWSEEGILSMTRKKRRRYVALLQEEVDRLNQVW